MGFLAQRVNFTYGWLDTGGRTQIGVSLISCFVTLRSRPVCEVFPSHRISLLYTPIKRFPSSGRRYMTFNIYGGVAPPDEVAVSFVASAYVGEYRGYM